MLLKKHNIEKPINRHEDKPPIIHNFYMTSAQNNCHGPLLILGMVLIGLYYFELSGNLITDTYISGT